MTPQAPLSQGFADDRDRADALQAIVDGNADGMVVVSRSGEIRFANPAAGEVFGVAARSLVGRRFGHPLVPGERAEVDLLALGGDQRVAEMRVVALRWRGEDSFLVALRDITESKRLTAMLHSKEQQLEHAQKLEAVGRLSAEMVHELKNLLQAVMTCTRVALDRLDTDRDPRPFLEEVARVAEHGQDLSRDLLRFSRPAAGQIELVDLNQLTSTLELLLRRTVGAHIELIFDREDGLAPVRAERGHLEQIVMNLVVNACDAMDRGSLTIRTRSATIEEGGHASLGHGRYVTLEVIDTGSGMDEATLRRVLEPFFTTKEAGKGTGLGLSTTQAIVRHYGGAVELESELGRGTDVRIHLPCCETDEEAAPTKKRESRPRSSRAGERRTILVVEDNRAALMALKAMLKDAGYHVLPAADGLEGRAHIQGEGPPIDVILTDVSLPGVDGDVLAREARERYPSVTVIYMSGHDPKTTMARIGAQEGDVFLEKPIDIDDLLARLARR